MAVTSGFFNSVNHDRLYDAEQFSALFDGIINDGVFDAVGNAFRVLPNTEVNDSVIVGTGRAWFNHTWILNDAQFSLELEPPSLILNRIDSIVFDVDHRDNVRACSIIVIQGEGASTSEPTPPTLVNEELHKQYRLANITVPAGDSAVVQAMNIHYLVGTNECPIVTGPLQVINSDNFFDQMDAAFEKFKDDTESEWDDWFNSVKDLIHDLEIGKINLSQSVDDITIEWVDNKLQIKDLGITRDKLAFDLQSLLGILDPTDWDYQDYYAYISSLDSADEEKKFMQDHMNASVITLWTKENLKQFIGILKDNASKDIMFDLLSWNGYTIKDYTDFINAFGSYKYSDFIGKTVPLSTTSYGTHDFRIIGINHDTLASGGSALTTWQATDIVTTHAFSFTATSLLYNTNPIAEFTESLISEFDSETRALIKEVIKKQVSMDSTAEETKTTDFSTKIWLASGYEVSGSTYCGISDALGDVYDYWSQFDYGYPPYGSGTDAAYYPDRIMKYQGTPTRWWVRDVYYQHDNNSQNDGQTLFKENGSLYGYNGVIYTRLSISNVHTGISYGIVPCFCA